MNGPKSRQGAKKQAEARAKVGGMKVSVDTGIKKGRANWREAGGGWGRGGGGGRRQSEAD